MRRIWLFAVLGLASTTALVAAPASAQLSINISVDLMPPALPVYDQPPIPGPDYIWAPGYWAWDDYVQDYYWVPGTWVMAPRPGLLWTPPWWGWQDGAYLFHAGYWAPHVGFYGGVSYGFGYTGSGYQGAYWNGGHVFYNRSVTNITNVNVTNVYNKTVIVNRTTNVSYNGGPGGVQARPSPAEQMAMREPRVAPTAAQQQHFQAARANKQLFASANHGRPPVAAAARPGQFGGPGVMPTRQAQPYHPAQPPAGAARSRPMASGAPKPPAGPAPASSPDRARHMMPPPQGAGAPSAPHNPGQSPFPEQPAGMRGGGYEAQPQHGVAAPADREPGYPAYNPSRPAPPHAPEPSGMEGDMGRPLPPPHEARPAPMPPHPSRAAPQPPRPQQQNHPHPQGGGQRQPPHKEEHHEG